MALACFSASAHAFSSATLFSSANLFSSSSLFLAYSSSFMNSAIQALTLAACKLVASEDLGEVVLFLVAGMWSKMKFLEWKPNNDNVWFYDQASRMDHFSQPHGLSLNKGVLLGSYQVMLVSLDLAGPRCIGSCYLFLQVSQWSQFRIPWVLSLSVIQSSFWNIPCHHPQSFLDHISRHGQETVTFITIHSRYF